MTPLWEPQVERRRPRSCEVKCGREVFRLECAILEYQITKGIKSW